MSKRFSELFGIGRIVLSSVAVTYELLALKSFYVLQVDGGIS